VNPQAILSVVDHRTSPLPKGPWVMTQIWHELLFAHWPISPELLRPLLPPVLTLDTYEHQAWVGIVPFRMIYVCPRGLPPVPGLSAFPELNVRTYVTVRSIPGVYFFSLDAANSIAVTLARTLFHLPYFKATMQCQRVDDTIHYYSHRTHHSTLSADFVAPYRPIGPVTYSRPDTLVHWFTERYCLYTVANKQVYRGDIHHLPWPLQAAELDITRNTMAHSHNIPLPDTHPLLHYANRQEVLAWPLQVVS